MKKIVLSFVTVVLTAFMSVAAFAGTGVIQFGDPTVTRDKTFNVALKVKSTDVRLKNADITIEYNPTQIEFISGTNAEGGEGTVRINGTGEGKSSGTRTLEYQLKFKALYAGNSYITINTQEVTDNSGNLVNITKLGQSKVTIKPSSTQSKNANITTLEITPGVLDRSFEPSVLSYNTEVNADIESLSITAIPEDKDASVAIDGNQNFVTGMNKVTINVTAPDKKTKKEYVINVTKLENGVSAGASTIANGQRLSSNKCTITIMIKPDDVAIPSGYKKLTGEFGGNSIEAYGPDNTPDGETPETFLVYGMGTDGTIDFYRYDTRNNDNTIQRYVAEPNSGNFNEVNEKYQTLTGTYNALVKKYNIVFPVAIGLVALSVILIIVLIVVLVKNGNSSVKKYDFDKEDEDDDFFLTPKEERREEPAIKQEEIKEEPKINDDIEDLG